VGDIAEALDGAAWLVPPSSPDAIAQALGEIFADPGEAARRGRAARQRCEERFSFSAAGGIVSDVIDRVAQDPRNR
jgi:glycosyltransferase involved in cell wall biosynthesis